MSQLRDRIIKLLANTDISGRYRKVFELYPTNPNYSQLAYHDVDHVKSVLNLFEVLRKLSNQGFSKSALRNVETAIAFHDLNHCGRPDPDSSIDGADNITRASMAFVNWAEETNYPVKERLTVFQLIRATAWPRGYDGFEYIPLESKQQELVAMMQDADMLWGTVPGNAEHCMLGLWKERLNAGLETGEIDILKILTNQIKFIQNYTPASNAGRMYKNAMFVGASEAWASVALAYQRDVEIAQLVNELPDAIALKLATSIKRPIRAMAVGND
jgi:hypothetical protein